MKEEWLTDDQLEIRLRYSVKSMINRKFHEYQIGKNMNPGTLRNRVRLIELGLY